MKKLAILSVMLLTALAGFLLQRSRSLHPDPLPKYSISDRPGHDESSVGFAGSAGDFDGDGADDVLAIECFDPPMVDELRVYSGRTRLVIFAAGIGVSGPDPCAVVCGDLDGDGTPDILVGVSPWDHHVNQIGVALLVSGRDGSQIAVLTGTSAGDLFGAHVCALGDVDGDGAPDFAIAAPRFDHTGDHEREWDSCRGYVQVYSGRTRDVIARVEGSSPRSYFGGSLVCSGDVDGDCVRDWMAFSREDGDVGSVRVISGRTAETLLVVRGDWPRFDAAGEFMNYFGFDQRVAALGDVDLDGVPDFAVSTIDVCALVVSGRDGSLITRIPAHAHDPDGWFCDFGSVLARAGDVDDDGKPDLIVGSPGWAYQLDAQGATGGRVWVYSAADGAELLDLRDPSNSQALGRFVAALGDVDRDGAIEILATTQTALRIYGTDRGSTRR
jgi:hypothetical protein